MISKQSAHVFAFRGDTLLPSMVPFPLIKQNLKIMCLINAAPVSVVLEVPDWCQTKANVVLRSVRAALTLSCFYDVTFQFHPRHCL